MRYEKVGLYISDGWREATMFYRFKCPKHGYVVNREKGYTDRLECPLCEYEALNKKELVK